MVAIRPAAESDVPAITAISNALIETTAVEWTETLHTVEERTAWLRAKQAAGWPVLVAVDPDVVGFATYGDFRDSVRWPGYRFTVEHTVHVAESHWSRGVGRVLMSAIEAEARRQGKRVMVGGIDAGNVGSIHFHARLGYREVARMPGVGEKHGRRLDLVLMQKELAPG